ncbi:PIN domain-containing protein [Candidatus Woesearchaeota archaeon]|nr:PIN domain-containing protein [Candidatus Woesearchaeota archaeon]
MFFFDTYAIIEAFRGNPSYARFFDYSFIVTHLNVGEFYAYLLRNYSKSEAEARLGEVAFTIVPMDNEIVKLATEFKMENNRRELSWADCIGYTAAIKLGLKFLTGDSQFRGMPDVEFVK